MGLGKCGRSVKLLVGYMNKTDKAVDMMMDWDRVIQFDLRGEDPFYVKTSNGKMMFYEGGYEKPNVVFRAKADVFFKIITGEIGQDEAFILKKYDISGSIMDGVKFRRISEFTQDAHKTLFGMMKKFSWVLR